MCVVDPERSVFYENFYGPDAEPLYEQCPGTCIEGTGRPRLEPSFIPQVVDRMIRVPNAASFAASLFRDTVIGRKYGGSTGTNLYGVLQLAAELRQQGVEGSIVTLTCDAGERYADTLYDPGWLTDHHVDVGPYLEQIRRFFDSGEWRPIERHSTASPA